MIDYYSILGVSHDADEAEIKNAYRNLVKRYHPDICKDPGSEERFKKINEAYEAIIEEQRTISTLFKSSTDLLKARRFTESLSMFESILALKPNNMDALKGKGSTLFELNRFTEAISVYDKILSINPTDQVILNNKGVALDNLGKYHEAIAAYDRSLKIDPNYSMARTNREATLKKIERATPINSKIKEEHLTEKQNTGNWVVAGLAAVIALILVFSNIFAGSTSLNNSSIFSIILGYLIIYAIIAVILFVIYWIITKVYPKSENWGVVSWTIAILGIPILLTIVLSIIAAFIFGMAGGSSDYQWVKYSNYGISLNHPSSIPINTSAKGYSGATYYSGSIQFDNPDQQGIGVMWFPKGTILSQVSNQKLFSIISTELQKDMPDYKMSSILKTTHSGNEVYYVNFYGHDNTADGKMGYGTIAFWVDSPSQRDFMLLTGSYKSKEDAQLLFDGVMNSIECH